MGGLRKNVAEGFRIERGPVGGDPEDRQNSCSQHLMDAAEESQDIFLRGIVIEDFISQPALAFAVDRKKDAEGTVINFVRSQIAGEIFQGPGFIFFGKLGASFFPLTLRPSFGWSQTGRKLGDPATGAKRLSDRAGRLRAPHTEPERSRGGYSGCRQEPDLWCRR